MLIVWSLCDEMSNQLNLVTGPIEDRKNFRIEKKRFYLQTNSRVNSRFTLESVTNIKRKQTDKQKKQAKNEVIKKYNIVNIKQLPDISRFDPVAQAIGMRPGDVCCIERPSKTAIISKYYRLCTQVTL